MLSIIATRFSKFGTMLKATGRDITSRDSCYAAAATVVALLLVVPAFVMVVGFGFVHTR